MRIKIVQRSERVSRGHKLAYLCLAVLLTGGTASAAVAISVVTNSIVPTAVADEEPGADQETPAPTIVFPSPYRPPSRTTTITTTNPAPPPEADPAEETDTDEPGGAPFTLGKKPKSEQTGAFTLP